MSLVPVTARTPVTWKVPDPVLSLVAPPAPTQLRHVPPACPPLSVVATRVRTSTVLLLLIATSLVAVLDVYLMIDSVAR
jgi:hypothetical protein